MDPLSLSQDEFNDFSWEVIEKYFKYNKGYQLVKHQLESFNDFLLNKLEQIIDGFNTIEIHHNYLPEHEKFKYILTIDIKNPILNKPIIYEKDGSVKIMTPNDARQRNFTYSSNMNIDMHITAKTLESNGTYSVESKQINNISLGKIPIMVKSNYCVLKNKYIDNGSECIYDYGGYFIVNGNEKVIISQDRISENKTYVFVNNKVSTYSHVAEIRSVQENKQGVPKITSLKLSSKSNQFGRYIRANIHHIKTDIPVFILFKALGLENDKSILQYIVYDVHDENNKLIINNLIGCIEESNNISCQRDALEYLSKYLNITGYPKEFLNNKMQRLNIIRTVLEKEFLPHVGTSFDKKALYLGFMVNKLIKCFLGLKEFDDRDSYINKRIDTPGILMANLFRQYYGKVIKDMKNMIQKEINNGGWKATNKFINVINKVNVNNKIIKPSIIDSGLRYALATGNWGIKNNKNKQGVAQVLNRMTYNSTISHLRRINTPIEKSGKLVQPRKLHPTQWGIICPSECFDPDTPILLWNGDIKKAQDIVVGDYLIDDKGNPTRVKSTCSGFKSMYEVIPDKKSFMNHTVTDNHILTLKIRNNKRIRTTQKGTKELRWFDKKELNYKYKIFNNDSDLNDYMKTIDSYNIIDITIEDYMKLPDYIKKEMYLFKSDCINWTYNNLVLDPYILGKWLASDDSLPNLSDNTEILKIINQYNLIDNKHIPRDYLVNDHRIRLMLLAGLIDANHNVEISVHEIKFIQNVNQKNMKLLQDIEFLVRSLGFSCELIYSHDNSFIELSVKGTNFYEIPTILPSKQFNKLTNPYLIKHYVNCLQSSFSLVKKPVQPFVGWQLEGNGRFLLGDMTVSHNTPEGASVGLVKNLAMTANITISSNSTNVRELILELGTIPFRKEIISDLKTYTRVCVNGDIIGIHKEPHILFAELKKIKLSGCINIMTGIVWNIIEDEISINTEGGRCVRPLFTLKDKKINTSQDSTIIKNCMKTSTSWQDILASYDGLVEFLDVEEANTSLVAMKYSDLSKPPKGNSYALKYTHLELHPSLILGALASCIPFSDHNQAPRNCYQASQGKQALGIYSSNFRNRYDTLAHVMNYPQKPLVRTKMSKILNNDTLPCGINTIVAIATYTGFNQEDSIIMNKSAVDRGLFTSTYFRTYKEQNNKNHSNGEEEFFTKPDIDTSKISKPYNYEKLNKDGFVPENSFVTTGDVIIGKCMPNKVGSVINYKDNSVPIKNNESGFIDRNCYNDNHFTNINGDGYSFCKVRLRSERIPTIGDKFSARSAQKGTVGMMYRQEDMPFTKDGIVPDLIMNPHAIPSRMTIGQLMECIMGKACVNIGSFGDATAFNDHNVEDIADILESFGMERYGNEILYNSRTGEQIMTNIFIGPTFYQRLKHMTADKIHSRSSSGPVVLLTRQPAEGRARDGGLRIGEMELECNWAHGIFQFLKERLMECSDNYRVFICKNCCNIATVNPEKNIYTCKNCKNINKFGEVRIPYACKLLFQEIQTMGIGTKFIT
jgi:DNA-directed RNA polymerase beta subunit